MNEVEHMLDIMLEDLMPNPKERRYIRIRERTWLLRVCEYQRFRHWNSRRTPTRTCRGFWRGRHYDANK